MVNGYMGQLLWVDLTSGRLTLEDLDDNFCRKYIGGYGFGSRLLLSRQKTGVDPLGLDNILGILTGPFTGTPVLAGSRYTVVAKSPLTGCWGDC